MKIVVAIKHKLKDRGIRWKETYKEKSAVMKKRFEKMLPGSYFRWEGFDYSTGHNYYVVVGPAISQRHGKAFFAGNKKMPKNPKQKAYSPSGKYFMSLSSALSYASEKWGISFPKNAGSYTRHDLSQVDIPRHMKGMEVAT